jgi:hypothetical protein
MPVAIARAETNVELSPDHTLFGSSETTAKSLAPILTHAEPLVEAVSEIVLGVRVAGRRRDSEPLHRDALRPRNSEAVSNAKSGRRSSSPNPQLFKRHVLVDLGLQELHDLA